VVRSSEADAIMKDPMSLKGKPIAGDDKHDGRVCRTGLFEKVWLSKSDMQVVNLAPAQTHFGFL